MRRNSKGEERKSIRLRKILAFVLALVMATGAIPSAAAVDLPVGDAVQVKINRISEDNTVEVSLKVKMAQFQSVGVVLEFNGDFLQVIGWDSLTPIPVTGTSWSASTAVPTIGADNMAGKPALVYNDPNFAANSKSYLYLGADTLRYTNLNDELVVTVRLLCVSDPAQILADDDMRKDFIRLADKTLDGDTVLTESIPGCAALVTKGGDAVYADVPVTFALASDPSVNTGGSTTVTGSHAITFFDWDGKLIDAIAAEDNAALAVEEWEKTSQAAVLKNKAGYDFHGWLKVSQGSKNLVTDSGLFVAAPNAAYFAEKTVDFSQNLTTSSLFVQAAYVQNSTCNSGVTDGTKINYTIDTDHAVYTRYGSASSTDGKYSVTYTVRRENSANQGVTKLRQPAVFVVMKPDADDPTQNIISKIDLTNTDETTFEVVPTRKIEAVEIKIIDTYDVAAWPSAGDCSLVSSVESGTFIKSGSWGFVRDQAIETIRELGTNYANEANWPSAWKNDADAATFTDGGLRVTNLTTAKQNILAKMYPLSDAQRQAVTATDLQKMIDGTYLHGG